MKKVFTLLLALTVTVSVSFAQFVKTPPSSKRASVSEWIGLMQVTVDYHRPGVKGREGKIYGDGNLVPYDGGNPTPWRAGANENTTIEFQHDVTVQGKPLKAGKYGFHIIPAEEEWTLVFSKNNYSWGSFFYNPQDDVLRVTAVPQPCEMTEWLSYDFVNQTDNTADIRLKWERKQVTFTVGTDVHAATMASIKEELDGINGFSYQLYVSAAQYCLGAGKDLEQALAWAEKGADGVFGRQENFQTLSTKSLILEKLGRPSEAQAAIDKALPLGTMTELHFYGRSLIAAGKNQEAMKIFKMNREKNPDDNFTTFVGLARGSMAVGQYKDAAQYFRQAAKNAPAGQAPGYEGLAQQCEEKMKQGG